MTRLATLRPECLGVGFEPNAPEWPGAASRGLGVPRLGRRRRRKPPTRRPDPICQRRGGG
jgi:hypothetical protein